MFSVADVTLRNLALGHEHRDLHRIVPGAYFTGNVTAVSPSADTKTRGFEIEVSIANPRGELRDGMVASLRLPGGAAGRCAPPRSRCRWRPWCGRESDASGYAVFVVTDSGGEQVASMRAVELGQVRWATPS